MSHSETVLVTGSKGLIAQSLIKKLSHSKNVIQWEENINKLYKLDKKIDTVYHLAAAIGRKNNLLKKYEMYDSNVLGTMHVINFCKNVGANCIFTSTAGVYKPTKENTTIGENDIVQPANNYTTSKWLAEKLIYIESIKSNVKTIIMRLFNVYSRKQGSNFYIGYLIDCLLKGKKATINNPNDYRDFIYIDDVVNAIIKAGELKNIDYEIFNIGSGISSRNIDVARLIENIFGKKLELEIDNSKEQTSSSIVANISKAKTILDWNCNFDLKSGIQAIRDSYK